MKLDSKIEEKIKKEAFNCFKKGKPDWDISHCLCSGKWMKLLIEKEGGNERILLPAIYLHDTGYPELKKGYNFEELMISKKNHAKQGAENSKKILSKLNFTDEEIDKIYYLIANHDIHNNIKEHDRQLIYEADGLAQLDWKDCPPNFDKQNTLIWLEKLYSEREIYMKTKTGIKALKKLKTEIKNYLINWQE